MTEDEQKDIRGLIRKELVRTKEDINRSIWESIKDLKNLIIIEDNTGRIIILNKDKFKNMDKLILFMIGKFMAYVGEVIQSPETDIQTISDELGVIKTTISAPLGELVKKNVLLKKESKYKFNEAFVKEEAQKLLEKIKDE
jgi:hypothetical protein